jgi:hypothetical protein
MNNLTKNQVDYFLSRASFSGLKMLYICLCALNTKKAFTLNDLEKALTSFSNDYSYGFLIASISIGLVNFETNEDIINVTDMDESLKAKIETFIKNSAKAFDLNKDPDWLSKYSRVKDLKEVEDYFGYLPTV